jgi:hypothetical protein
VYPEVFKKLTRPVTKVPVSEPEPEPWASATEKTAGRTESGARENILKLATMLGNRRGSDPGYIGFLCQGHGESSAQLQKQHKFSCSLRNITAKGESGKGTETE